MATCTFSVAGGSWNTNGAWLLGAQPTAADDVVANGASGAVTMTAASVCRSMILTGYTSTLSGSGDVSIGDGSGGACTLAGTISGSWTTTFKSTSNNGGTGWGVTCGGNAFPGTVTFNGVGGKWVLQDTFSSGTANIVITAGGFFGNGQTITCGSVSSSGAGVRTIDITNCTITMSGQNAWSTSTTTNLTFVSTGSSLSATNGAVSSNVGALSYNTFIFSGFGTGGMNGVATFANLTVTGNATKTSTFQLTSSVTVTGTLTLNSNSAVNRLQLVSTTRGTQRTITMTGAAVVIDNAAAATGSSIDFMDVTITGTPSWTVNHSTLVGDSGGNGGAITTNVTAPATQTHTSSAGGNWSDATKWTSRVPLPQDNVVVDVNTTGTITSDMPRLGANVTFTGFNGTWTNSAVNEMYGNLILSTTTTTSGTNVLTLAGRGSQTLTSNTKQFSQGITVACPSGTYTLQDTFSSVGIFTHTDGTFTSNNFNLTADKYVLNNANAHTTNMGSSNWNCTTTTASAICFSASAGGGTLNSGTSTVVISSTTANLRFVTFGGKVLNAVDYTIANSSGELSLNSVSTAGTLTTLSVSDATATKTISFAINSTTTITNWNVTGRVAQLIVVAARVPGNTYTVVKIGNLVTSDFVNVTDCIASGVTPFYATNSTNGGNNTLWTFGAAPAFYVGRAGLEVGPILQGVQRASLI